MNERSPSRRGTHVVKGHLKIGLPIENEAPRGTWTCRASLSIINEKGIRIHGEDPLDALVNAVSFLRNLIEKHKPIGYAVWWLREGDDALL